MKKTSTLNIRIQDDLKMNAAEVLAGYGLTLSDAVRVFLTSVSSKKSLPAELVMNEAEYEKWLSVRFTQSFSDREEKRPVEDFLKTF